MGVIHVLKITWPFKNSKTIGVTSHTVIYHLNYIFAVLICINVHFYITVVFVEKLGRGTPDLLYVWIQFQAALHKAHSSFPFNPWLHYPKRQITIAAFDHMVYFKRRWRDILTCFIMLTELFYDYNPHRTQ